MQKCRSQAGTPPLAAPRPSLDSLRSRAYLTKPRSAGLQQERTLLSQTPSLFGQPMAARKGAYAGTESKKDGPFRSCDLNTTYGTVITLPWAILNHTSPRPTQPRANGPVSRPLDDADDADDDLFSTSSLQDQTPRQAIGLKGGNSAPLSSVGDQRNRVSIGSRYGVKLERPRESSAGAFSTRTAIALSATLGGGNTAGARTHEEGCS